MEETVLKKNSLQQNEKTIRAWVQTHDLNLLAEKAEFRNMATGEVFKGKPEIGAMLHYLLNVGFKAKVEIANIFAGEQHATLEGFFKGRHIGEFAGIPATNKEVDVPLCVTYSLENGLIREGHIFLQANVLMQQLGTVSGTPVATAYVVRDIFKLKFGHYRDVKALLDEAKASDIFPEGQQRILTDFTGHSYRLVLEHGFDSLGSYEQSLGEGMATPEFQNWYRKFSPHVDSSFREILKQVN